MTHTHIHSLPWLGIYATLVMVDEVGSRAVVSIVPLTGDMILIVESLHIATSLNGILGCVVLVR